MRIEVGIDRWEQQCCGKSFRTGDSMTWTVKALDPSEQAPGGLPRYYADFHGQAPEDVPTTDVTGHVVAIDGVDYPRLEYAAQARSYFPDLNNPTTFPLASVSRSADRRLDHYRVTLEIDDGVALPSFAEGAAGAERRRREEVTAALRRSREADEVGGLLAAVADEVEERYVAVAEFSRPTGPEGFRMLPTREDTTALRWARSDFVDRDGIVVRTGEGTWFLAPSPDGVAELRAFIAAAAEGRVRESVEDGGNRLYLLHTHVISADRSWTSTTKYKGPDLKRGGGMVVAHMWERVQRGDHTYAPWGDEPARH